MRKCDECKSCLIPFGFIEKPETFQCEWIKGLLSEESRPDLSGLIFTLETDRNPIERKTLVVRESLPNAFSSNEEILSLLSKKKLLVLQKRYSYNYIGPADDVEKVKRLGSRTRQQ